MIRESPTGVQANEMPNPSESRKASDPPNVPLTRNDSWRVTSKVPMTVGTPANDNESYRYSPGPTGWPWPPPTEVE